MGIKQKPDHIERHKYACHKAKAKHRGITFTLTYEEWWAIWEASGKWHLRGCRKGQYVMSRYNDDGAYEVGNVFIQLHSENTKEAAPKISKGVQQSYVNGRQTPTGAWQKGNTPWNKGIPNPKAAELGKQTAQKQSQTVTGRRIAVRDDGTRYWVYPQQ